VLLPSLLDGAARSSRLELDSGRRDRGSGRHGAGLIPK
jgi:hypothetical protein